MPGQAPRQHHGANVVRRLTAHLPRGTIIFCDRFFSSPDLALSLRNRGHEMVGTCQINRKHMPPLELKKAAARGEHVYAYCKKTGLRVIKWRDNKDVTIVSTFGNCKGTTPVVRKGKKVGRRSGLEVPQPVIVASYTKDMGGVDRGDGARSVYNLDKILKCFFWYKKMFLGFLGFGLMNAYVLWLMHHTDIQRNQHRIFIQELADNLLGAPVREASARHQSTPATSTSQHYPRLLEKAIAAKGKPKRPCGLCNSEGIDHRTSMGCGECDVALCSATTGRDCFERWHRQGYELKDVRIRRKRSYKARKEPQESGKPQKRRRGRPKGSTSMRSGCAATPARKPAPLELEAGSPSPAPSPSRSLLSLEDQEDIDSNTNSNSD